jgi:hypothetical protein
MHTSDDERTGRFTFAAEGHADPLSPYFIGKLSHPSMESGVTIGAGYDMKHRSSNEVSSALTTAGVSQDLATKLSKGAGLTGVDASKFVTANRPLLVIGDTQLLLNLFSQTYPGYVARAKACFEYHKATFKNSIKIYDKRFENAVFFDWDYLYPAIRVMVVDFVYQGFGRASTGYGKPLHMCMANNFDWLIEYIAKTPGLQKYEAGRGRAKYLLGKKEFETRSYSSCAPS